MKKNAILICITCLLFVTTMILVIAGLSGGDNSKDESKAVEEVPVETTVSTAGALDAKVNVIYEFDKAKKKLGHIVVEILSPMGERLSYIIFPTDARYFMSKKLYNELSTELITLPQMVTFSELYNYYGRKDAFKAGTSIISEMCGVSNAYTTIMDVDSFADLFEVREEYGSVSVSLKEDDADGDVRERIKSGLEEIDTDWSFEDRLVYLEVFEKIKPDSIMYFEAEGDVSANGTEINTDKLRSLVVDVK